MSDYDDDYNDIELGICYEQEIDELRDDIENYKHEIDVLNQRIAELKRELS